MQSERERRWQEHLEAARKALRQERGLPETPEEERRARQTEQYVKLIKKYDKEGCAFIACWYFGSKQIKPKDGRAVTNPLPRTIHEALQRSRVTSRFVKSVLLPEAMQELGYCLVALKPDAVQQVGGKTTVFYPLYQALRGIGLTPLKNRMEKSITPLSAEDALKMVGAEDGVA